MTAAPVPARIRTVFIQLGWAEPRQQRAAAELVAFLRGPVGPSFEFEVSPDELGGGMARAAAEGDRYKRDLLARSDMLVPDVAAERAGISRQALDLRRKRGQALALSHVKRGFRYPAWQFDDALAPSMLTLLPRLYAFDCWHQYFVLTQAEPLLGNVAIVDALRNGKLDDVTRVIEILHRAE